MTFEVISQDLFQVLEQLEISLLHKKMWRGKLHSENGIKQFKHYLSDCNYKINLLDSGVFNYPTNLPVSQNIDLIKNQILTNQVLIICGETGSGKTTQLPKLLLQMGFANYGTIGHTQPRRVAARTIAKRVGDELFNDELVGYKIRFHDKTNSKTAIKIMTDGVLLQEIQNDKYLLHYSALIIDEAHERSLNIDFILGYLKTILYKRPDLKLIITSATIDNKKIANFFNDAAILEIPGKLYPVDIIYEDMEDYSELHNTIYYEINSYLDESSGNILVFLPGEREIKECVHFLRKTNLNIYDILPFFSKQTEADQGLIFREDGKLKIIITTNIAETSLTIPGIQFVIDSGLAKVKRYNIRNRVEQLQIEKISKASAKQRSGRAGRLSHGMCIRLYSEMDYELRQEYTDPEILRSNLANVILKLLVFRLGKPEEFPFLDKPSDKVFNDGFKILYQLGAVDEANQITKLGLEIAKIPIDANLARMLVEANRSCLNEILKVTSFLSVVDPREVPLEYKTKAEQKQQIWLDKKSDFITILNLWDWYSKELLHSGSKKKFLEKCREYFLSATRLREWHELHSQLKELLLSGGYLENTKPATYEEIHKAILTGLLNNIGQKDLVENYYLGTNSKKFLIHPNSLIEKSKWICCGTLVQTAKLYARVNAAIDPAWLVPLTRHLVKHTYDCEAWDKKRGEVVARQNSILYGLLIYQTKVPLALINPSLTREIFIRDAIVMQNLGIEFNFINENNLVIAQLEDLEEKFRSHFIILEDELFKFYDKNLAYDVYDVKTLEKWLKISSNQCKLNINYDEFIKLFIVNNTSFSLYPDKINVNDEAIILTYVFDPNRSDDGVTAQISLSQLNAIEESTFTWLVPGLIREKVSYVIKSLPKSVRVKINPINEFITNFLQIERGNVSFTKLLVEYINKISVEKVTIKQIEEIVVPTHLKFHFEVIDKEDILLLSNDLNEVKYKLNSHVNQLINTLNSEKDIPNIKEWIEELSDLMQVVELDNHQKKLIAYKSLLAKDGMVKLTTINSLDAAEINSKTGIKVLVRYYLTNSIKYLEQKKYLKFQQISIFLSSIYSPDKLLSDSIECLLRSAINLTLLPKNKAEFLNLVEISQENLLEQIPVFAKVMFQIANLFNQVKLKIDGHPLVEAIEAQLDDLIFPGFLKYIKIDNLQHLPRYLQAIIIRCEKYHNNLARDMALENEISYIYNLWYDFIDSREIALKKLPQEVYDFKYKIEEFRVSLFAQELKTQYPISAKRLIKELNLFEDLY